MYMKIKHLINMCSIWIHSYFYNNIDVLIFIIYFYISLYTFCNFHYTISDQFTILQAMNQQENTATRSTINKAVSCKVCFMSYDQHQHQAIILCSKQHQVCKGCFIQLMQSQWQKCPCCHRAINLKELTINNHLDSTTKHLVSTVIQAKTSQDLKLVRKLIDHNSQSFNEISPQIILQSMTKTLKQSIKIDSVLSCDHFKGNHCARESFLGDFKFISNDLYGGLCHYLKLIQYYLDVGVRIGQSKIGIRDEWKVFKNKSFLRGYLQQRYDNNKQLTLLDIVCLAFDGQNDKLDSIHQFFNKLISKTASNNQYFNEIRQCYGNVLFNNGHYALALQEYEQLITHCPSIVKYHIYRLYTNVKLNSKKQLIESQFGQIRQKLMGKQEDQVNQLFNYLNIYYRGPHCQAQLQVIQHKATDMKTVMDVKYMQIVAECHFKLQNCLRSKSIYLSLAKHKHASAVSLYRLACILYFEKDIPQSLSYIRQSILTDMLMVSPFNLLGILYIYTRQYQSASTIFKLFIQKYPQKITILKKYLYCLCKSHQAHQALTVVDKISSSYKQSHIISQIQLYLGMIYFQLQEYHEAIKYLERFVKKHPHVSAGYKYVIKCYGGLSVEEEVRHWQGVRQKNKVSLQSARQYNFFSNQFKIDVKMLFYSQFRIGRA